MILIFVKRPDNEDKQTLAKDMIVVNIVNVNLSPQPHDAPTVPHQINKLPPKIYEKLQQDYEQIYKNFSQFKANSKNMKYLTTLHTNRVRWLCYSSNFMKTLLTSK